MKIRELRYDNFYEGDFIYEISWEDEKEVVTKMLMENNGLDKEQARITMEIFVDYDLIDKVIDDNMDFVKEYFEQEAYEQYKFEN